MFQTNEDSQQVLHVHQQEVPLFDKLIPLLVGRQKGHPACKKNNWMLVCWWWRFDCSFARLIAPAVTTTSITLSSSKIQNATFWYQLTWKMPVKMEMESAEKSFFALASLLVW